MFALRGPGVPQKRYLMKKKRTARPPRREPSRPWSVLGAEAVALIYIDPELKVQWEGDAPKGFEATQEAALRAATPERPAPRKKPARGSYHSAGLAAVTSFHAARSRWSDVGKTEQDPVTSKTLNNDDNPCLDFRGLPEAGFRH